MVSLLLDPVDKKLTLLKLKEVNNLVKVGGAVMSLRCLLLLGAEGIGSFEMQIHAFSISEGFRSVKVCITVPER